MDNFGEKTYMGAEVARKREELQQLKQAWDKIVEALPIEQQVVLEKYQTVYDEFGELCTEQAYILGYQHGLKHTGRT